MGGRDEVRFTKGEREKRGRPEEKETGGFVKGPVGLDGEGVTEEHSISMNHEGA